MGAELYDHRGDTGLWLDWYVDDIVVSLVLCVSDTDTFTSIVVGWYWCKRPGENSNLVNDSQYTDVVKELHQRILDYIQLRPIQ